MKGKIGFLIFIVIAAGLSFVPVFPYLPPCPPSTSPCMQPMQQVSLVFILKHLAQNTTPSTITDNLGKQAMNASESVKSIPETTSSILNRTTSEVHAIIGTVQSGPQATQAPKETAKTPPTTSALYQYALDAINKDRKANNLPPVQLDSNQAAQMHAQDMLAQRTLSHYMSTGEKPYMVYTRYGGTGYVAQNVATRMYDIKACQNPLTTCPAIDPVQAINQSEYDMMNNDAASNWGHKNNILDKNRNYVSIGIAYDPYSFFLVQNFENKYIDSQNPVTYNDGMVHISGRLDGKTIDKIGIAYDVLPTDAVYQTHKNDGSYVLDTTYAAVYEPAKGDMYYLPSAFSFVEANSWSKTGDTIDIAFDLKPLFTKSGVYTVVASTSDNVPLTSFSVLMSNPPALEPNSKVHYACTQNQLDQFSSLQQQYQSLAKQYDAMPKTASSEQQYNQAMQMYNQLQSLENQMKNFRC